LESSHGSSRQEATKQLPVAPAVVWIGPDARHRLGDVLAPHGRHALVVAGPHSWPAAETEVTASLTQAGVTGHLFTYRPDCTEPAAVQAVQAAREAGATVILGVGGGKALDLAKLVAHAAELPVVTFPTSAATCAAWTALGNFYTEAGAFHFGRALATAPAGVVVDTTLIAQAPARLLASGLADTLAKWYETSASVNYAEAEMTTRAAWQTARFLHDEIRAWGREAYADAKAGRYTPAVVRAIEANICLAGTVGGLGGEKCRSVAAHAVCNALTAQAGNEMSWHGEKVAFGILTQLLLESRPQEAEDLARFFIDLDVPVTLAGLGYHLDAEALAAVAAHVTRPESTVHHLPFTVTPARVQDAVLAADALGRSLARS
jgi:glycerol dehydrogenase